VHDVTYCVGSVDAFGACGNISRMSKKVIYSVHIEPSGKGFFATVPLLPGCQARAKSFDAVLRKVKTCIAGHLKVLVKAGRPIPTESQIPRPLCLPVRVDLPRGAEVVRAAEVADRA
jgi:predicted RNase H-like HicB family nuclease